MPKHCLAIAGLVERVTKRPSRAVDKCLFGLHHSEFGQHAACKSGSQESTVYGRAKDMYSDDILFIGDSSELRAKVE